MPQVISIPNALKPFIFHGVDLQWQGKDQATADCPFCDKEGKFCVNVDNGLWDCKVCGASGNPLTLVRQLWDLSDKETSRYDEMAADRKLLYPDTLMHWQACASVTTQDWLVPGFNGKRDLVQLYRWIKDFKSGKRRLIPTPGLDPKDTGEERHHGIGGANLFDKDRPDLYLLEGAWDGMAFWEAMRVARRGEKDSLTLTASQDSSMLSSANVLTLPSANVFQASWLPLFAGKRLFLMGQSDHPHGPKNIRASLEGMKRIADVLSRASDPPREILHLSWGKDGYDPGKPTGYDVRDFLSGGATAGERVKLLEQLLARVQPIPPEWIKGRSLKARPGGVDMEMAECRSWDSFVEAWRPAMKWIDGLDYVSSICLAVVLSTKQMGATQIWLRVLSPASTGKTTLAEAWSVNRRYVYPKDTMSNLISGYQTDRDGSVNHSMVEKMRDKTLVIKDADTILKEPNLNKILSQFRALFDKSLRSQFGNLMSTDHEGVDCTVIIHGTKALRQLDRSELGERFLTCSIMDDIDEEIETDILWRAINREDRLVSCPSDGKLETQLDPAMVKAMQASGGYIDYLRENATALLNKVEFSDEAKRRCMDFGRFVAYMRARPSEDKHAEDSERELAARLVSQIGRLAKCLAVVLNRSSVDELTMSRIKRVTLDSSRGRVFKLSGWLAKKGEEGETVPVLAHFTGEGEATEQKLLKFLREIGVVESFRKRIGRVSGSNRWKLTDKVTKLWRAVMGPGSKKSVKKGT